MFFIQAPHPIPGKNPDSDAGKPAVHNEVGTGGICRSIAHQIEDSAGELIRRTHTVYRNHIEPGFPQTRIQLFHKLRIDISGTDAVDANALSAHSTARLFVRCATAAFEAL